jgi:hypothetical protein
MRNETNSTLTLTQGTGANVAISAGQTKIVATDGAGSGAVVYELDDLELAGNLAIGGNVTITGDIDVDGTTNLDVVDIDGAVDMASTLAVGGVVTANAGVVVDTMTLDGSTLSATGDFILDSEGDIIFDANGADFLLKDSGTLFFSATNSSGDTILANAVQDKDIFIRGNDGGSTITALTLDMSDAGTATFNHDIKLGDDGQILFGSSFNGTIGTASGDLFIGTADANVLFFNSASILPANSVGGTRNDAIDIGSSSAKFKDAHFSQTVDAGALTVDNITIDGTEIDLSSGDLTIDVAGDIILDAGGADIKLKDDGTQFGTFFKSGDNFFIQSNISDGDLVFYGNDGGSNVTALTLDMSDAGS